MSTTAPSYPGNQLMRVSATSNCTALAGAIAKEIRRTGVAEMSAIGAGAVNQAIKASAVAIGHLAADGIDAVMVPSFTVVDLAGEQRTAIRLRVRRDHETIPMPAAPE